jgi:hypothetical protein
MTSLRRSLQEGAFFLGLILAQANVSLAQTLYFTKGGGISRSQLVVGARTIQVLPDRSVSSNIDFAVDHQSGKLYWTTYEASRQETVFSRMNVDGTDVEHDVFRVSTGSHIRAVAIDGAAGRIYWGRSDDSGVIERANLDGSGIETLIASAGGQFLPSLALDLESGKMYWPTFRLYTSNGAIHRADLDGGNVETVVAHLNRPIQVALDPSARRLYWTDSQENHIGSADLTDGQNARTVVVGLSSPAGLTLDLQARKIYWVNMGDETIERANLDGSDVERFLNVGGTSFRVEIGPEAPVAVSETAWSQIKRSFR